MQDLGKFIEAAFFLSIWHIWQGLRVHVWPIRQVAAYGVLGPGQYQWPSFARAGQHCNHIFSDWPFAGKWLPAEVTSCDAMQPAAASASPCTCGSVHQSTIAQILGRLPDIAAVIHPSNPSGDRRVKVLWPPCRRTSVTVRPAHASLRHFVSAELSYLSTSK